MRLSDHFYLHEMIARNLRRAMPSIINQMPVKLTHCGAYAVLSWSPRADISVCRLCRAAVFDVVGSIAFWAAETPAATAPVRRWILKSSVCRISIWLWMAENLKFDQLILEYPQLDNGRAGWLHVSYRGRENRGQCLTRHQNGYVRGLPTLQNVPKKFQNAQKT